MLRRSGITLVEILIVMVISLVIMGATYASFSVFLKKSSLSERRIREEESVKLALSLLEEDIRHSGFGYLKDDNGVCVLVVNDNCSGPDDFCKSGTDRLFVSDGWQMIRDFSSDHCPDGNIQDAVYENLVNTAFAGDIVNISGKTITVQNLNINNRDLKGGGVCENNDDDGSDFSGNGAAIVCGCDNSETYGRRISSINGFDITFLSRENDISVNCAKVIPAIVWYVKKNDDGFWLYRNESRVLKGINDFQIYIGYDNNEDGLVNPNGELISKLPLSSKSNLVQYIKICLSKDNNCCDRGGNCKRYILTVKPYY